MAKRVSSLGHRHTANDLTPFREGSATISGAWTFSGATTFTTFSNHERYILIDESAGSTGIYLDSKASAAGAGLNTPGIRWREADATDVAGIRGYVDTDDTTNRLVLGTGWFAEKLSLGSDNVHTMTGNLRTSGYLSAQGGASDLGQAGQITFMDLSGGVGRFGSYNWDTAAYTPVQVIGSTAEVESVTGDITLDSADDVLITAPATGGLEITGSSYKTNPTGMRLGQYTSTIGYIQVPGNGQIDIWTGGTSVIARFHETSLQCAFYGPVSIPDGITAPSTVSGRAFIYVDTSDGDLKVKFGDGTVKTIATDT